MDFIYPSGLPVAMSLTAYNAFLTGLIVLLKRKDRVGKLYFISSLIISLWGVGISFMLNNNLAPDTAQRWGRFSNIAAFFIPVTWLHFVLCYTENEKKFKHIRNFFYTLTFVLAPFTLTKHFMPFFRSMSGIKNYPIPGIIYHVFALLFFISVAISFYLFYHAYRQAPSLEIKKDYQYLGLASFYGFFMGGLSFLPVYEISLPQYNLLVMPFWQIALAYIMTRHRIFDMREIADAFQREKITALGIMAASLNHEMRNPLYIAKGKIEVYRDAARHSNPQEVIDSVSLQLDRTLDIIQRFSDFARPQIMVKKEEVLISEVFHDVSELISYEIQKKKIRVSIESQEGFCLRIHRRQFEEILVNLMINASQALSQNGTIKAKAFRVNEKMLVEISDNGPGIIEENQRRIFDPFFSTKRDSGMGLGLYITKQLVEKNGGKISVKSKLGCGTTFMLEFKT